MERVYLVTLAKATRIPARAPQRRGRPGRQKGRQERRQGQGRRQKGRSAKKPAPTVVDEDGLKDRIDALPITPGDYQDLRMVDDRVFYLRKTVGDDSATTRKKDPATQQSRRCAPSA